MAELIVTRLDPVSGEWEHNHAEGETGSQEQGEKWMQALKAGKVPEGKSCKWEKVTEVADNWIDVQNFKFGPYGGTDAGKFLYSIQKARLSVIL